MSERALDAAAFAAWLRTEGASNDLASWAESRALGWPEAWEQCPRADWLLALAGRAGTPRTELLRAAAAVAALLEDDFADPELLGAVHRASDPHHEADALEALAASRTSTAPDVATSMAWGTVTLLVAARSDDEAAALVPMQVAQAAMASVLDCAMHAVLAATHDKASAAVRRTIAVPALGNPR